MRSTWLKEFREFILRGNLVDLAVAVVIGTAFTALVNALVRDFITPLIAAVGGKPDFGDLTFTINGSLFRYGNFLNALLSFLILATVVFFFVVKPVNHLMERFRTEPDVVTPTRKCPECLSAIPAEARRCAFCTTQLSATLSSRAERQPPGGGSGLQNRQGGAALRLEGSIPSPLRCTVDRRGSSTRQHDLVVVHHRVALRAASLDSLRSRPGRSPARCRAYASRTPSS